MERTKQYILYTCFFFLCLWSTLAQAQETKQYDAVYLKDGSVVYGQMMHYEPTGVLVLKLDNGTTIEYPADQIIKTKKEIREVRVIPVPSISESNKVSMSNPLNIDSKRQLYGWGSIGNTFGARYQEAVIGLSINLGIGHRFHRTFMVGVGAGLTSEYVQSLASIYGSVRGTLLKSSFSPFYQVDVGYGVPLSLGKYNVLVEPKAPGPTIISREGGLYLHPAFGFRFASVNTVHTYLKVGCVIQYLGYFGIDWNNYYFAETVIFARPTLRVGMIF